MDCTGTNTEGKFNIFNNDSASRPILEGTSESTFAIILYAISKWSGSLARK